MDTDEKQAEGHMFQCSCGNLCIGKCAHCDVPCWDTRCKKCKVQILESDPSLKGLRNMGNSAQAHKAWLEDNK